MCVCVRVCGCMRVRVHVLTCVRMRVRVRASERAGVHACVHTIKLRTGSRGDSKENASTHWSLATRPMSIQVT